VGVSGAAFLAEGFERGGHDDYRLRIADGLESGWVFSGVIEALFESIEVGAFDFVRGENPATKEADAGSYDGGEYDVWHGVGLHG
jgi:hypothetical protein